MSIELFTSEFCSVVSAHILTCLKHSHTIIIQCWRSVWLAGEGGVGTSSEALAKRSFTRIVREVLRCSKNGGTFIFWLRFSCGLFVGEWSGRGRNPKELKYSTDINCEWSIPLVLISVYHLQKQEFFLWKSENWVWSGHFNFISNLKYKILPTQSLCRHLWRWCEMFYKRNLCVVRGVSVSVWAIILYENEARRNVFCEFCLNNGGLNKRVFCDKLYLFVRGCRWCAIFQHRCAVSHNTICIESLVGLSTVEHLVAWFDHY